MEQLVSVSEMAGQVDGLRPAPVLETHGAGVVGDLVEAHRRTLGAEAVVPQAAVGLEVVRVEQRCTV